MLGEPTSEGHGLSTSSHLDPNLKVLFPKSSSDISYEGHCVS